MRKMFGKLKVLLAAAFAICCACVMFACSPSLSRPPQLSINFNTLELEWSPVENATAYMIDIDGREFASSRTTYSLAFLSEGEHAIKVRARDASNTYGDSDWSDTIHFYKEYESGLAYTLINANTEYKLVSLGSATGDVVIDDEYRGKPVTSIGASAFKSKPSIKSVVIGKNVKTIGDQAFFNCSNLASITIPEGVTSIGESAFQGCRSITSLTIPDSVTSIGNNAFRFCRNLSSVTIGNSVKSLGKFVFYDCDKLTGIEIPDNVKTISEGTFSGCDNLASVDLGGGVTSIGKNAFANCLALTEIKGGAALVTIGETAFNNCDALEAYTLPESVVTISEGAFSSCDNLASVRLGDNVQSIGADAFANTALYSDNVVNGIIYADNWAIGYTDDLTEIRFKQGVVGIANSAFRKSIISSVAFPSTVKYIGSRAFYGCNELIALDLGDGVEVVGEYAFASSNRLGRGRVSFGSSLVTIGNYAFNNCSDFGAYSVGFSIPRTVDSIGAYAFRNTYYWNSIESGVVYVDKWVVGYKEDKNNPSANKTSIRIDDGTYGISNYAFYKNTTVTDVTIPESVRIIGANAFNGCTELAHVFIDEFCEITEIRDYTFYKCSKLFEVDIPRDVSRIGRSAFYKSGIVAARLSKWVTEIGAYAYYGCANLITVLFYDEAWSESIEDSRLESIGAYAFNGCTALTEIALPDGLTTLGARAFSRCSELRRVTFGKQSQLTRLNGYTFYNCTSLAEIDLPSGITSIGNMAFYKCTALARVGFGGNEREIGEYAFYGCETLTKLELPTTLQTIGGYAFRKCTGLTSVILTDNIEIIGDHAFNGCRQLTLYAQDTTAKEGWNARWNSGRRPVVRGVTLSEDGYVTSFVYNGTALENLNSFNGVSAPLRDGYDFGGWSVTVDGEEQIISDLMQAEVADGTTLTAIWTEKTQTSENEAAE